MTRSGAAPSSPAATDTRAASTAASASGPVPEPVATRVTAIPYRASST